MSEPSGPATSSEMVFYQGEDGKSRIQVRMDGGTVWLTQRLLADLYQVTVPSINEHLGHIYDDQELDPGATIRKFRIVQVEGKREVSRLVDHYSLEAILAVGYRVRSPRGSQFRRWASERLAEYLAKGFVLDDERLKEGREGAPCGQARSRMYERPASISLSASAARVATGFRPTSRSWASVRTCSVRARLGLSFKAQRNGSAGFT